MKIEDVKRVERMSVDGLVRSTVAEAINIPVEEVIPTADIFYDLKADSLEAIEIVVALESTFSVEIPDEDIIEKDSVTVRQIVDYVKAKLLDELTGKTEKLELQDKEIE